MTGTATSGMLIAGGGIGGLGAALALSQRGIPSFVLEAADQFSETGAGIQLGPNGVRILRRWGLGEALEGQAGRPQAIHIHDGLNGRRLARVPLGQQAEQRYGAPYLTCERRVLHRLLHHAVSGRSDVTLETGFRLASFRETDGIDAVAEGGRTVNGKALIGADGVHSRLRALQFGATPSFSGRNAWRATAALTEDDPDGADVHLWLGPNAHLVSYCCGPAGPLNAVAVTTGPAASPGWGTPAETGAVPPFFADWAAAPRRLIERFANWVVWPLLRLPPLPRWTKGRTTLLGDAAHPLMPFLASGAVAAIEDAEMLAVNLARQPDNPAAAFAAYERLRKPRADAIQKASARMGDIYHMSGPMRLARNLVLAAMPPERLLARNDWLYRYCAADD